MTTIGVYILAKNEESNIARCLEAFSNCDWPVHILDSGSSDNTETIAGQFQNVVIEKYQYIDHCTAYNDILSHLGVNYDYVAILDADMVVPAALRQEIDQLISEQTFKWNALIAKVAMYSEGRRLVYGSLYPPKPFFFRVGKPLFFRSGHSERLIPGTQIHVASSALTHDDRKPYSFYLLSQFRYSNGLVDRGLKGEVSSRDRLRLRSPLLIFLVPIFSYFFRLGFLDGRPGIVYALDRLIAEAIMYRQAVARRLDLDSSRTD